MYILGLGDSNDSVTIVIVSATIMTVIVKNYYHVSGHVDMSMPQHTHKHMKKHVKIARNV